MRFEFRLPFPNHVEFELTNRCNLHCIMCPRDSMVRPLGNMEWSIFAKAIDECYGKVKTTYLHQFGEPLLHPQLCKFINYASSACIRTSLSTNCTVLTEEVTEQILASSITEITLCLDSFDKSVYESLRVGANFEQVLTNLKHFLSRKKGRRLPHAILQMIRLQENMAEWLDFSLDNVDELLLKDCTNWAGRVPRAEASKNSRLLCNKLLRSLTVQWNGDVVICCRDVDGVTKLGNITEQSLQSIWDTPRELDPKVHPFCREC